MTTVSTHEAKTHLSRYLAEVELGKEVVIMRGQKPVARLVPYVKEEPRNRPKVGDTTGLRQTVPDEALRALSTKELKEWGL